MGTSTTFGTIILAAQQRADRENSDFITDAEWQNMTNASLQQLYEKLIEAYGSDYFCQASSNITTDGLTDTYSLPTDFFKLLGVDLNIWPGAQSGVTGWTSIWKYNFAQRNAYMLPGVSGIYRGGSTMRYRLRGNNIVFQPLPAGGQTLRLWYAPVFTPLTTSGSTFDGVNGWEEWVVNDVAMKALVKDESDLSGVGALQQVQNDRLQTIIDSRDVGAPETTTDVYRGSFGWGFGWGDGWGGW